MLIKGGGGWGNKEIDRSGEKSYEAKFLLRNCPEILRDPELFNIKSRDNKPRIKRIRRIVFSFNQHNPLNPRLNKLRS